jgi:hypothetical protein
MSLFSRTERNFLETVSKVAFGNPFLPELAEHERIALGDEYTPEPPFWSLEIDDPGKRRVNAWRIVAKVDRLTAAGRERIRNGTIAHEEELKLYEDSALYSLYHQFYDRMVAAISAPAPARTPLRIGFYREFIEAWKERLPSPHVSLPSAFDPRHTFACYFQIVRAFQNIFESIIGASGPAGRLRAAVCQSIFTHDMRRYRRTFYGRMGEFVTLITGPSGSGKELVARAIALSRYVPFDERTQTFHQDPSGLFHPIHIGALSSTLVESELFGHRKGAFTGAVEARRGWLDVCPPLGAVFLDEIGELTPDIQVKLLRVIETRTFTPVGSTDPKRFEGKLIAATHRDLPAMIERGAFREDLYYRFCSDLITTPSLQDQVTDTPAVLRELVRFMARRNGGSEGDALGEEVYRWIEENLGIEYTWPGNYRELEQCVRNLIIRREYRPARSAPARAEVFGPALEGRLTIDELITRYCTFVYSKTGSYEAAARQLGVDRRTVKARIDAGLLAELKRSTTTTGG